MPHRRTLLCSPLAASLVYAMLSASTRLNQRDTIYCSFTSPHATMPRQVQMSPCPDKCKRVIQPRAAVNGGFVPFSIRQPLSHLSRPTSTQLQQLVGQSCHNPLRPTSDVTSQPKSLSDAATAATAAPQAALPQCRTLRVLEELYPRTTSVLRPVAVCLH